MKHTLAIFRVSCFKWAMENVKMNLNLQLLLVT